MGIETIRVSISDEFIKDTFFKTAVLEALNKIVTPGENYATITIILRSRRMEYGVSSDKEIEEAIEKIKSSLIFHRNTKAGPEGDNRLLLVEGRGYIIANSSGGIDTLMEERVCNPFLIPAKAIYLELL